MVQIDITLPDGTKQTVHLPDKTFKSGSTGFYANGKVADSSGKRYQMNLQLVLIGSKPQAA